MRKVIAVAIIMLAGSFTPLASAEHLSFGSQDAVGIEPGETGFDEETQSVPDDRAEVGQTHPDDCNTDFNGSGTAVNSQENVSEAQNRTEDSLETDAFCGMMNYNSDSNFPRVGPMDQIDNSDQIDTFDVVRTSYVGTLGLTTNTGYAWPLPLLGAMRALHQAGSPMLFDSDGVSQDGDFSQQYGYALQYPEAGRALQDASGGQWEMDGFDTGGPQESFVAFLRGPGGSAGDSGELINNDDLSQIVQGDSKLDGDAVSLVCGFSVDDSVSSQTPDNCQISFKWFSEAPDGTTDGADFKPPEGESYGDACDSPMYICGANQPGWYAQVVPIGFESLNDYDVYHWVVAPTISQCTGAVDPGFVTPQESDADKAFLAHDLDVYSPVATGIENQGTPNTEQYLRNTNLETQGFVFDTINGQVDEAITTVEETTGQDVEAPETGLEVPTELVIKNDRTEPNYVDHSKESSQTFNIDRTGSASFCDKLTGSGEVHFDPWTNILDNEVTFDFLGEPAGDGTDAYLTQDPNQDASNRPGSFQYFTSGKIGLFADKNDNGVYNSNGMGTKLSQISDTGAYPLVWDVRLDGDVLAEKLAEGASAEDAEMAAMQGGCTPTFSANDWSWTTEAKEAGYGPRTGLIQVNYLTEATYLYHFRESTVSPSPGATAHVSMTDNFIEMHQFGNEGQVEFVEKKVNEALDKLPEGAPDDVSSERVQLQYELTHPDDDPSVDIPEFSSQCDASTGAWSGLWSYGHYCGAPDSPVCSGSTMVTEYVLENRAENGVIGGGDSQFPTLNIQGAQSNHVNENGDVIFPQEPGRDASSVTTWFDTDAMDGNPDRNDDSCDRPTHHGDDAENPGCQEHSH